MTEKNIFERAPKKQRRVVVTGMGMVSPLGLTVEENWEKLLRGQSGIGVIDLFDTTNLDVTIAGQVKNFDPTAFGIEKKEIKKMDRFVQFALAAADMALKDAGVNFTEHPEWAERFGTIVGAGMGGLPSMEENYQVLFNRGPSRLTPFFIPLVIANMASGHISIKYGIKGLNYSVTSACATGAHSIGEAYRYIRDGVYDGMVAGGSEAALCRMGIAGFAAMKALSTRNAQPTMASRPFDKDRDGFVFSEGGGILILEDYETASRRGARIYCEITGYGASSDAYHMTNPSPGGEGGMRAMRAALDDAQLRPEQIQYINAHGTSTPVGDGLETAAVKTLFQDHASKLWISSTKSMTGHTLGGAGAIESIYSILALINNVAPPTINLDNPSDDCDLDYVPHVAREGQFDHVLNNSFGFGGTNSSLVFSRLK